MSSLIRLVWGGRIYTAYTAGVPEEIWSNSISVRGPDSPGDATLDALETCAADYFSVVRNRISKRVWLEWIKANEYNPTTGIQITDPTHEKTTGDAVQHGNAVITNPRPVTVAQRISLDNGTRVRKAKGGFYVPCCDDTILESGRWDGTATASAVAEAVDFLTAINGVAGCTAVVWSRVDHQLRTITRVRVGDVPDNISRRKDALLENYTQGSV